MRRTPAVEAKYEHWYARAVDILDGRANGMGVPILRALALRGYAPAMTYLSILMTDDRDSAYDPKRGLALARAIARREGDWLSLHNLAITHRNEGRMAGYRFWITRAAKQGDPETEIERKGFRTRFPYPVMRRWRRYRPPRRDE